MQNREVVNDSKTATCLLCLSSAFLIYPMY